MKKLIAVLVLCLMAMSVSAYNSTYDTEDLKEQTTDVIGTALVELSIWVRLIMALFVFGFVIFGSLKLGFDKVLSWTKK